MVYAVVALVALVVVLFFGGRTLWSLMGRRWSWPTRRDDDEDE
jgi:hypothetical protein